MDIVIIAQYLRNIEQLEGNNSRFIYLANMLSKDKLNKVEIITSAFMHGTKRHAENVEQPDDFKITAINEPGYPKNICLKRFTSHKKLANNIKTYLNQRKKPDVIYCTIPSLDVADVVAGYCKKSNVKFIIDIQDLWPEAFKMAVNIPVISDIGFAPMKAQANRIYKQADEIVSVSETYCKRALSVNEKCKNFHTVFLGTKLETFDDNAKGPRNIIKKYDQLWLMYCGSLSHSYDIKTVIDALAIVKDKMGEAPYFVVMGDGGLRNQFEKYAKERKVDCLFTGMLSYPEMCATIVQGDMVVNPIIKGSPASIINKHGDYAAAGLPVLNTQESIEYRKLIDKYNMGLNCKCENAEALAEKIMILMKNESLRKKMGINARKCAEEKFDRKSSYKEIYNTIIGE